MILAFDTYYYGDNQAKTVCLAFDNWRDEKPTQIFTAVTTAIAEYEPGAFYKRELPCILHLYHQIELAPLEAIIIDGFVVLNDEDKLGLGGHLYEHLNKKIPVIGVAKTNFAQLHENKRALLRGGSQRPLFITALGIDLDVATAQINSMFGEFRMPNLLKQLDTITKEA